jgi:hypothetical protein
MASAIDPALPVMAIGGKMTMNSKKGNCQLCQVPFPIEIPTKYQKLDKFWEKIFYAFELKE